MYLIKADDSVKKSNQDILDEFGRKIIETGFDPGIGNLVSLRKKNNPPAIFEDYVNLFKKLDGKDSNTLKLYLEESLGALLFNVFRVFEENPEFKIVYEENGNQVDLYKISEMLKAEPIIENGWIRRFSNEVD